MEKHRLFMLHPWTEDNGKGPYYCPECGIVEGFLSYSPAIREAIDVVNVDFPRPREEIVALLGLENQGCPVLVLADQSIEGDGIRQSLSTGRKFISDPQVICTFLAERFNGVQPHP